MRASGTQTCVLDKVPVPAEGYGGPFRTGLIGEMEWVTFPFAGVYLGVADRAFRLVRDSLAKKSLGRSEEHTSELQSLMRISYAVFCLKKKKNKSTKLYHSIIT